MALYGLDDEDVVISGISTAFPGSPNFADLSKKLSDSVPIRAPKKLTIPVGYIGEVPEYGRPLEGKNRLDNTFFGVAKIVTTTMTYMTRKNYQRAFEALLDAGLNPTDCEKIATHMSSVSFLCDGEITVESLEGFNSNYGTTGRSRAMEMNRISFFFGATGPSYSGDCAFLGGMQNMKLAYDAIKNNQADLAVLCGGNTLVDTKSEIQFNDLGWLSKDGKTRAFDNDASGYFRSECAVTFILQRAKSARRIYAKINDIIVKSIPADPKMTKQSRKNWEILFREFYGSNKIPIEKISYLEAYGSGIKDMDTEELNAVTNFFCENRDEPLCVGSVKSNLGHCEGGADFASIAKAIICFESGFIPANAHYSSPNRNVQGLINEKIKVVNSREPLPENALIAISGWSIGSVYGHMVLSGFNKPKETVVLPIPRLVPLTARTSDFLLRTILTMESAAYDPEYYALVADVFRRKIDQFLGRGYVVLPKKETSVSLAEVDAEQRRPLWFVFSGMGSQWNGMGKGLLELPIARDSLLRSHRVLEPHGVDLKNIITSSDPHIFDNILHAFVGISAIQIALVDVIRALKVEPDGIIGHSLGELGCAYCDGTLTAEQMILCSYYRGRASIETTLIKGYMAAIGKGYAQIKDLLPEGVEVACHNSSTSCTISGPADIVSAYVKKLEAEGVFARTVNVANIAYHSRYIQPAAPLLYQYLKKMIPSPVLRSEKWVSTSVPEVHWDKQIAKYSSAEYHANNFTSQVLFEEGCQHIPENAVLVEIAPHGLLQAILRRSMGPKALNIALTNRDAKEPLVFLLEAIGKIFTAGFDLDINALYPKVEYPVSRGTFGIQPLLHWVQDENGIRWENNDEKLEVNIRKDLHLCDSTKMGYEIKGQNLFPLSVYLLLADRLSTQYKPSMETKSSTTFSNVRVHNPTALSVEYDDNVEASILRGKNLFELSTTEGSIIINGHIEWQDKEDEEPEVVRLTADDHTILKSLEKDEIYSSLQKAGYIIPPDLQGLSNLSITQQGLIGKIPNAMSAYAAIEGVLQMFIWDACSHSRKIVFPSVIRTMVIFHDVKLDPDQPLEVIYDRNMGIVYSSKFFLSGIQLKEISTGPSALTFHSINTVPFENPTLPSSQDFVRFCCDIVQKTKKPTEEIKVLQLSDGGPELKAEIELSPHNAQVSVKKPQEADIVYKEFDLVVCNSSDLNQVAVKTTGFILVQGHGPIATPADFSQVAKYETEKSNQYWLLKKKIVLNGERDFIVIPETKEELLQELRNRRGKSSALIVGFEEPEEGLAKYQETIESLIDIKLKWLFILDKDAPKFNFMNEFYQEQLKQGLSSNVLINRKWHHVYKAKLQENIEISVLESKLDVVTTSAVGKPKMMGIKISDDQTVLDPILSWPVPSSWSEDEAELVPFAYSMAYFCLIVIADLIDYDRVLVTNAMSAEGQAAIAVALSKAGRVFASVASTEEALQLQKLFPSLNAHDIVSHLDNHMSVKLRSAVGDSCPNVIYNLLDGIGFQSCYDNIAPFSHIFQFGREDIARNTIINMGRLIRKVSVYAISRGNILNWTDAEKETIKALVSEGIQSGTVTPPVSLSTLNSAKDSPAKLIAKSHPIQKRSNKFVVHSSGCYVIVGDVSDHDLDIAEWLAQKGASKINISKPSLTNTSKYQQQVQGLKLRRNVNIEIFEEQGLKAALKKENVKAVFFVNLDEKHGAKLQSSLFSDIAQTETDIVVTISRSQEYVLQTRTIPGIRVPITNVVWNVEKNLNSHSLDLMGPFFGQHTTISVDNEEVQDIKKLTDFIPDTLDGYHRLGLSLKSLPNFVEITTLGPPYSEKSPPCPIFVIPGVEDDPIESVTPLLQNILYPAFVAQIPHRGFVSVPKIASDLLTKMMEISLGNTYNLVGITSGAPIAIELTRQLETQGHTVALLIVENPLEPLQRSFGSNEDLQMTLLHTLNARNPNAVDALFSCSLPWSEHLEHLVCSWDLPPNTDNWIRKAVCHVYDRFAAILEYSIQDFQIKGPLTVLRSRDHLNDCNYNKLCLMHKTINFPVSRKDFLQSHEIINYINKYAINDEMVVKSVHWPEFENFLAFRG